MEMAYQVDALRRVEVPARGSTTVRLEHKPMAAITKADVEAIRENRRGLVARVEEARQRIASAIATKVEPAAADVAAVRLAESAKQGEVGTNRLLTRLRHIFAWAVEFGYVEASPFIRGGVTVIRLESRVEQPRHRRLEPGEEKKLLDAAGTHLYALIVAALETGMRRGELLSMQWSQVRWAENLILLPEDRTKTHRARVVPISTRLKAVLEMRQDAPDGKRHPANAYVFGNDVGERVKSIKTAWRLTCRRAGIAGLRFHDLRREFASRLLEAPGVSSHEVRDWLGHADIGTTSRYLSLTSVGLADTLAKFEQARKIATPLSQTGQEARGNAEAGETGKTVN